MLCSCVRDELGGGRAVPYHMRAVHLKRGGVRDVRRKQLNPLGQRDRSSKTLSYVLIACIILVRCGSALSIGCTLSDFQRINHCDLH